VLRRLATVLLGAAVAEGVLWDGGFDAAPRTLFVVLAALGVLAVVVADRDAAARIARRPPVVLLVLIGGLGVVSLLWTVGGRGDTLRWGLVTLGYAAIALGTAVLAGDRDDAARLVAAGIAALAFVSGAAGLAGALAGSGPFADRIGGAWRPGGTLQYAPALALAQVSALPILIVLLRAPGRLRRGLGAGGAAVAVLVLATAGSRLESVLALLVTGLTLWQTGAVRLPDWRGRRAGGVATGVAVVLALGVLTALAVTSSAPSGRRDGGVTHGRLALWRAGVATYRDRPVLGAGADAFLVASVRHQRSGPTAFAHDLPLELAVELGVAGFLLGLGLYGAAGGLLLRAPRESAVLLGPAVAAFLVASLVDWPWHLAGSGAIFAAALGGLERR
jgi:O-antigen ligase